MSRNQFTSNRLFWMILTITGIVLTLVAIGVIYSGDAALGQAELIELKDPQGDLISGTYYPGRLPAAVVLLTGFGSDQVTMRSLASEFALEGFHVMSFDFSGHGRSPGGLGFDNASTDRLALQTRAVIDWLKDRLGPEAGGILLVGHSMGARVALQYATMQPEGLAGIILLGTQVNLGENLQSQVFTGTQDAGLEWVQKLSPDNPRVNIQMISGSLDDILTPDAARQLLARLSGDVNAREGNLYGVIAGNNTRVLEIIPGLLHNFEVFSPTAIGVGKDAASMMLAIDLEPGTKITFLRNIYWLIGLSGLFLALTAGSRWVSTGVSGVGSTTAWVTITSLRRFLWAKLILWLGALPLMVLLFGSFFILPLGLPAFNLIYVGFIGGYGILMTILYASGRMPGTRNRLLLKSPGSGANHWLAAIAAWLLISGLAIGLARSGLFLAPPTGDRLIWLAIFTPFTALGFWIGGREMEMIRQAAPGERTPLVLALLIGLLPFFLWAAFQLAIGSWSGTVASVQGLLILTLVLLLGSLMNRLTRWTWLTAVCQAVLLYILILPQGVLFTF